MMKTVSKILAIALGTAALCSCESREPDPQITTGNVISLMVDHGEVMTYDPFTWQSSHRNMSNVYRVFADDMSMQYKLICSAPIKAAGQEVNGRLEWTVNGHREIRENLSFTVQRMNKSGDTAWLWCRKQRIGVAVMK